MDGRGVPLPIVVTGADKHDTTQVAEILWRRALSNRSLNQNLCAATGYAGASNMPVALENGYRPLIKQRGRASNEGENEIIASKLWGVEARHSWFNRFGKLLIRYEKKSTNYLALCMLAAAIIALNKVGVIYG